jgi:hypothetical protein
MDYWCRAANATLTSNRHLAADDRTNQAESGLPLLPSGRSIAAIEAILERQSFL